MIHKKKRIFAIIGPGILVAATGVGAGDMLTASLAGSALGVGILWAVVVGAVFKWYLNEGIARWQLATGTTILEGWKDKLGNWIQWIFLIYLLGWTFFTGGALITACGVAGSGLLPLADDLVTSKIIWGIIHSITGLVLVLWGGFRLFEKLMSAFIAMMFVTVIYTAVKIQPDWNFVLHGIIFPSIPTGGTGWILGILGGVGGTVTLLSYGYWIREENRLQISDLKTCRIDLIAGYSMTALFGMAMVIIGSKVRISGGGANIALELASQLKSIMGPVGGWIFLTGFWGAVFSSLLGVWQGVPYLFTDFMTLRNGKNKTGKQSLDFKKTKSYRSYLIAMAIIPIPLLWMTVKSAQLTYAVLGSLFMPLLAFTLLIMNNNSKWIGIRNRNGAVTNIILILTLCFFGYVGINQIMVTIQQILGM